MIMAAIVSVRNAPNPSSQCDSPVRSSCFNTHRWLSPGVMELTGAVSSKTRSVMFCPPEIASLCHTKPNMVEWGFTTHTRSHRAERYPITLLGASHSSMTVPSYLPSRYPAQTGSACRYIQFSRYPAGLPLPSKKRN